MRAIHRLHNAACPLHPSVKGWRKACLTDGGVVFADGAPIWLADGSVAAWKVNIFATSERKRRSRQNGPTHNAFRDHPMQSQWDPSTDGCSGQGMLCNSRAPYTARLRELPLLNTHMTHRNTLIITNQHKRLFDGVGNNNCRKGPRRAPEVQLAMVLTQ